MSAAKHTPDKHATPCWARSWCGLPSGHSGGCMSSGAAERFRLERAAPDLLAACEALLAHINDESEGGEFESPVDFHDGAQGTDLRRAFEEAVAKARGGA